MPQEVGPNWAVLGALAFVLSLAGPTLADEVASVQDRSPRKYRFVCEYMTLSGKGVVVGRRKYEASLATDTPKGRFVWSDTGLSSSGGLDRPYGPPKPLPQLEGFDYGTEDLPKVGEPGFFEHIPPQQVECRNMVWDAHMFEAYACGHQAKMRLNEPVVVRKNADSGLSGSGNFHDEAIDLTWIGEGSWKGVPCFLIRYRAFFNRFTYRMGTTDVPGSSDYWGEIWLAKKTNRIEYATLYESVTVKVNVLPDPVRVFRTGTFERV